MESEDFRTAIGGIRKMQYKCSDKVVEKIKNLIQFKSFINELKIISRTINEDKKYLITGLNDLKYVVAVFTIHFLSERQLNYVIL